MNIIEAIKTSKKVRRSNDYSGYVQYFTAGTGLSTSLVDCDYFMIEEEGTNEAYFSTSLDLYPEDILADDWEVIDE